MAWIVKGNSALGRVVSKQETKACTLCGTLNFSHNRACKECGWHGAFEEESAAVDYQWQRLQDQHEEVRLEHVVRGRLRGVDEYGRPRKFSAWQKLAALCQQHWEALLSRRQTRPQGHETFVRPESALPPN